MHSLISFTQNWKLSTNSCETIKNQGKRKRKKKSNTKTNQKTCTILKLEFWVNLVSSVNSLHCWFASLIYIFRFQKQKEKQTSMMRNICLNEHYNQKGWPKNNTNMIPEYYSEVQTSYKLHAFSHHHIHTMSFIWSKN